MSELSGSIDELELYRLQRLPHKFSTSLTGRDTANPECVRTLDELCITVRINDAKPVRCDRQFQIDRLTGREVDTAILHQCRYRHIELGVINSQVGLHDFIRVNVAIVSGANADSEVVPGS